MNLPLSFVITLSFGMAPPFPGAPRGPVESIDGSTVTGVVARWAAAPCRVTVNLNVVDFETDLGTHPPFGEDG